MSIDYEMRICYGIIISEEKFIEIRDFLEEKDTEVLDFFSDNYCTVIDAWTGGDYFFGLSESISPSSDNVYPIEDVISMSKNLFEENLKDFSTFMYKNNLFQFIHWKPEYYLINFCW